MNYRWRAWLSRLLWPALTGVLLAVPLQSTGQTGTGQTAQPLVEEYRRFLERNLKVLSREGDRVRVEAADNGRVGQYHPRRHQWVSSFVLEQGDSFFQRNHHARVKFTVQAIGDDAITLKARSLVTPRDGTNKADNGPIILKMPYLERVPAR